MKSKGEILKFINDELEFYLRVKQEIRGLVEKSYDGTLSYQGLEQKISALSSIQDFGLKEEEDNEIQN